MKENTTAKHNKIGETGSDIYRLVVCVELTWTWLVECQRRPGRHMPARV